MTLLAMPETKPHHFEYVLGLTTFAAGTVDVISFTQLGFIFASAMTGNLALLGLYVGRGSIDSAIGSLLALVGFVIGASFGTLLTRDKLNQRAMTILLATETIFLLAVSLLWFFISHRNGGISADVLILLLSSSMGLQSILGKKINLSNIPTVVFTSTLTNIVIAITDIVASRKFLLPTDTKRQTWSFILYFLGALGAGILTIFKVEIYILLPLLAVGAAFAIHAGPGWVATAQKIQ